MTKKFVPGYYRVETDYWTTHYSGHSEAVFIVGNDVLGPQITRALTLFEPGSYLTERMLRFGNMLATRARGYAWLDEHARIVDFTSSAIYSMYSPSHREGGTRIHHWRQQVAFPRFCGRDRLLERRASLRVSLEAVDYHYDSKGDADVCRLIFQAMPPCSAFMGFISIVKPLRDPWMDHVEHALGVRSNASDKIIGTVLQLYKDEHGILWIERINPPPVVRPSVVTTTPTVAPKNPVPVSDPYEYHRLALVAKGIENDQRSVVGPGSRLTIYGQIDHPDYV